MAGEDDSMAPLRTLEIIIKNADGSTPDAALSQFNAYTSISEIKMALFETYPGRPIANGQKLIFAGRWDPYPHRQPPTSPPARGSLVRASLVSCNRRVQTLTSFF
jgi:hypothetical protein